MITTRAQQQKVGAAAIKVGGYRELVRLSQEWQKTNDPILRCDRSGRYYVGERNETEKAEKASEHGGKSCARVQAFLAKSRSRQKG